MSDKNYPGLSPDTDNAAEKELWEVLGRVQREEPTSQLRQRFYRELDRASQPGLSTRLRDLLGFSGNAGWLTATACLLLGIAGGHLLSGTGVDNPENAFVALSMPHMWLTAMLKFQRRC